MTDAHGDRATLDQHIDWTARKATALRRPTLDCGHPNAGEVFYHAWCDRLSCSDECANGEHECGDYAGVKSSSEEESEQAEAAVEAPSAARRMRLPRDWPLYDIYPAENDWPGGKRYGYTSERIMAERTWTDEERERADELGIDLPDVDWLTTELWWDMPREHTVEVEQVAPVALSFYDPVEPIAESPFRQTVRTAKRYGKKTWTTDPFRSVGSASTDPVAEAMRAEVLRQGLTECEIDGVRWVYRPATDEWARVNEAGWRVATPREVAAFDETHLWLAAGPALGRAMTAAEAYGLEPAAPSCDCGSPVPVGFRRCMACLRAPAVRPEPVAPHVDESLDPAPVVDIRPDPRLHAHEVDGIPGCRECPELRTSWWSRLFPGRRGAP